MGKEEMGKELNYRARALRGLSFFELCVNFLHLFVFHHSCSNLLNLLFFCIPYFNV